MCFRIGRQ
uniref:SFRICE_009106 n=1 Tax=Spodoptera frugiperda TaxID=7108 RepID=A0A2H1WCG2_SPOFR